MDFLIFLIINLASSLEWSIPAWIFLILHFARGWSISLFWAALLIWILITAIKMLLFSVASRIGGSGKTAELENKNPYSAKNEDLMKKYREYTENRNSNKNNSAK